MLFMEVRLVMELLFNFGMLVFFIISLIYTGINIRPAGAGELSADQWVIGILSILIVLMIVNIVKTYKKQKSDYAAVKKTDLSKLFNLDIFRSKLLIGIVLLFVLALTMDTLGFLLSSFIFLCAYIRLFGEKRLKVIILSALSITILLYILFQFLLGVRLPRGIGFLRNFALMIESLVI